MTTMSDYEQLLSTIRPLMDKLSHWVGYSLTPDGDAWDLTIYVPPGWETLAGVLDDLVLLRVPKVRIHRVEMNRFSVVRAPVALAPALALAPGLASPPALPRAVAIGSTVSVVWPGGNTFGSIGAYVRTVEGVWLLTANHVLACNGRHLPLANRDHGVFLGSQRVSRTIVYRELEPQRCQADAAACLLDPTANIIPAWPAGWNPNPNPYSPSPGDLVKVSVNGVDVFGTVKLLGAFKVSMSSANFPCDLDEVEFTCSIVVQTADARFARPGNSGGLVVTADAACRPIGLVTGTTMDNLVVISPLAKALADLGLPGQIMT